VLLECASLDEALGLLPVITARISPVTEVIPGARTLLLRLNRPLTEAERRLLAVLDPEPVGAVAGPPVTIEVDYRGDDLHDVARMTGLTPDEVVTVHTGQRWTVGFCGFAPGFGYLYGPDRRLEVPRLDTPRTRVPAGAVGLADGWSGIYPRSGPGGWRLIGRTKAKLWHLDHDPPALLQPGRQVQFVATDRP
jgi:KipI family sensor histidine kinase inhibitor